jgi:hypothetical protein
MCLSAFERRTNTEQRRLGEQYRKLSLPTAKKNFVRDHATCYTQLSRLPYFDLVQQIVIDPMHNLFLGLVKTHFYNIWVQNKILHPNHELAKLHEMLADVSTGHSNFCLFITNLGSFMEFVIPLTAGKLLTDIGMPSGGSLTADQWLLLATVYGPIIVSIPHVLSSRLMCFRFRNYGVHFYQMT